MGYATVLLVNNDDLFSLGQDEGLAGQLAQLAWRAETPTGDERLYLRQPGSRRALAEVVAAQHGSVARLMLWRGKSMELLGAPTASNASAEEIIATALRSLRLDGDQRAVIAAALEGRALSVEDTSRSAASLFDMALLSPATYEEIKEVGIPWLRYRVTVNLPVRQGALRVVLEDDAGPSGTIQVGMQTPFVLDDDYRFETLWPEGLSAPIGHNFLLASWREEDRLLIAERVVEWLVQRLQDHAHMAGRPQQTVWDMLHLMGDIAMALGPEQGGEIEVWPATEGMGQGRPRLAMATYKVQGGGGYDHRIDGLFRLVMNAYQPTGADLEIVDGRFRPKYHPAHFTVMSLISGERETARLELITSLAEVLGISESAAACLLDGKGMPPVSP